MACQVAPTASGRSTEELTKGDTSTRIQVKQTPVGETADFTPTGNGRDLRCRIEDNGIGRAQAAEINARNRISGKKQSLGTRLTNERVELLNAPGRQDYRVEITDLTGENGTGTVVTLILPLEFKSTAENQE